MRLAIVTIETNARYERSEPNPVSGRARGRAHATLLPDPPSLRAESPTSIAWPLRVQPLPVCDCDFTATARQE